MSVNEIGLILSTLVVFLAAVHGLAYLFERLRQPRLIGEIFAGILLGPFVLGHLSPSASAYLFGTGTSGVSINVVLHFIYWLGLLLLMFISGSETRRLLAVENRREIAWIIGVGTPLPFFFVLGLGLADFLPLRALVGTSGQETSALLVLAIAVAVTSHSGHFPYFLRSKNLAHTVRKSDSWLSGARRHHTMGRSGDCHGTGNLCHLGTAACSQ